MRVSPRSHAFRLVFVAFAAIAAFLVGAIGAPGSALAQDKKVEAAAKALQKKAMEEDYLVTEFAKAADKLEKAITMCGADKCIANTRALLKRDLGVVQIGGGIDKEKGAASFVEALKIDSSIALDPDLKTKDIEAAWEAAKKGSSGGTPVKPPPTSGGTGTPVGDFDHTPTVEQQYRTAVPIYVEYKGESKLVKVIARYKGFGMSEFKPLDMKKIGETGWGGNVPCGDVQVGNLQYYIQGFDAQNDPVAVAGDRNTTYKVPIKRDKISGEPPHLPGMPAQTQCQDTGDCPPDFPGCKKGGGGTGGPEPVGKADGEECDEDSECKSNSCEKKKNSSGGLCAPKVAEGDKFPRIWVGGFFSFDISFLPSADDVCKLHPIDANDTDKNLYNLPKNDNGYYCMDGDADYPKRADTSSKERFDATRIDNDNVVLGKNDKVAGGTAPGNLRIFVSGDYAIDKNLMAGARLGVALFTYPGNEASTDGKRPFISPLHIEARATYVIGKDALAKAGFAPYAFGGMGLSTFDAKVSVAVTERDAAGTGTKAKNVDAWSMTGPFFLVLGGGGRYAINPKMAAMGGLRLNLAFGNAFVPSVAPELGMQFGF